MFVPAPKKVELKLNPRNSQGNPEAIFKFPDEGSARYFIEAIKHKRDPMLIKQNKDHIDWLMQRDNLTFTLSFDIDKTHPAVLGHAEAAWMENIAENKKNHLVAVNASVFSIVYNLINDGVSEPKLFGSSLLDVNLEKLAKSINTRELSYPVVDHMSIPLQDLAKIAALGKPIKMGNSELNIEISLDSLMDEEKATYRGYLEAEIQKRQPVITGILAALPSLSPAELERLIAAAQQQLADSLQASQTSQALGNSK